MPAIPLPDPPLTDGAVRLRQWREGDVEALVAACQDAEIARWTAVPAAYMRADARLFVARAEPERVAGALLALAVLAADSDELLGSCGLARVDWDSRRAEIGYWVAAHARRRGVGTRAVRLLSGWALEELGLNRIELLANPANLASQRLAVRAGFRDEGLLRSYRVRKGELESYVAFSLLAADLDARVTFRPEGELRAAVERALVAHRARIAALLPAARVDHIGATAVPDALTKGGLDLLASVPPERFGRAAEALARRYAVHQRENWTGGFASFKDERDPALPVGVQLVAAGSGEAERLLVLRDALRAEPALLDELNALKRAHEGAAPELYRAAKEELVERILAGRAIRVRPAVVSDALAIARVHVSSWHAAYRGVVPDELLDALSIERRAERWRRLLGEEGRRAPTLVAELGGRAVGFCSLSTPARDATGERAASAAGEGAACAAGDRTAELTALYVEPRRRGSGVGARLLRSALETLEAGGWREVTLSVLPENEPARLFYARFEFEADPGRERDERTGLPAIRLRRALRPGG